MRPLAGERTGDPASAPMSMPVWPCSRYSGPPNAKPRSTAPSAGQAQAAAAAGQTKATTDSSTSHAVVFFVNMDGEGSKPVGCCQIWLQRAAVEAIPRHAGQARHDVSGGPPRKAAADELRDGIDRRRLVSSRDLRRSDHDRDLSLRPL
jgi:hypothetical protein